MGLDALKNTIFAITNVFLLFASGLLAGKMTDRTSIFYELYDSNIRNITYFLLIVNVGTIIFNFIILNNLNDLLLNRTPSPDGIKSKLRIVSEAITLDVLYYIYRSNNI